MSKNYNFVIRSKSDVMIDTVEKGNKYNIVKRNECKHYSVWVCVCVRKVGLPLVFSYDDILRSCNCYPIQTFKTLHQIKTWRVLLSILSMEFWQRQILKVFIDFVYLVFTWHSLPWLFTHFGKMQTNLRRLYLLNVLPSFQWFVTSREAVESMFQLLWIMLS